MASNESTALLAGYLPSWESVSITEAAQAGYDCIILAFGSIAGTTVGIFEDSFPPDNDPSTGRVDLDKLSADIKGAKDAGAKQVLLSFGGHNNTYVPGNADAKTLAAAIVKFLQTSGFTGCDFDIEIQTSGDYLKQLISEIKAGDSSLIVTAAPQLNLVGSSVQFVSTGTSTDYNAALNAGLFDYLFVQAYNTCSFDISGHTEKDVAFISAAFDYLTTIVPDGTLITIGEPAATGPAAGPCSVFHGSSNGPSIYSDMASQYRSIRGKAKFGGAMTWAVNYDQGNGYKFAKAIGPVI